MAITVFGIKNCNTVKSALRWLDDKQVDFAFHDYKSKGIEESKLNTWCSQVGWESLLNKRGTTWRRLDAKAQRGVKDQTSAVALMKEKTSIITRPLVESSGTVVAVGFDALTFEKKLGRR